MPLCGHDFAASADAEFRFVTSLASPLLAPELLLGILLVLFGASFWSL